MKIAFLPLGTETAPSSRIRIFTLHRALVRGGVDSAIGYHPDADVVCIQKKVNREIFSLAQQAKRAGKLVVYDVDDFGDALDYCCSPRYLRKMLKLAHLVTTDTLGHLSYLVDNFGNENIFIVPDCVDYFPERCVRPAPASDGELRILWFGSIRNIFLFEKYAAVLSSIPHTKIVVATAIDAELQQKYPEIEFVPWSLDGFVDILQGCHLSCLMHDGSEIDKAKSNNKMITSIAWGVPAVVSDTPDYARTAAELGVEYATFSGIDDLKDAVELLRHRDQRDNYLETVQDMVWAKYSPDAIKDVFLALVERKLRDLPVLTQSPLASLYDVISKFCQSKFN